MSGWAGTWGFLAAQGRPQRVWVWQALLGTEGVPLLRDGRFANRPYGGVSGEWQVRQGLWVEAPCLWIPAFAGMTRERVEE